jgi:thiamine-phosphate pyrophosphorylase
MTNHSLDKIERLLDANLNRLKEGIRVIEDINRYLYNDKVLSLQLKTLRHKLQQAYSQQRLTHRDIENDVLKETIKSELKRSNIDDLIIANFSRTQESARVLEECFKLTNPTLSELSKEIRYALYAIEKTFFIQRTSQKA